MGDRFLSRVDWGEFQSLVEADSCGGAMLAKFFPEADMVWIVQGMRASFDPPPEAVEARAPRVSMIRSEIPSSPLHFVPLHPHLT